MVTCPQTVCGSASCLEVEDRILLGRNGNSVSGGGMKMPILQRCQDFVVERGAGTLEHAFANDFSSFVDCDLDHHVALRIWPLPRIHNRIRGSDRQGRSNFVTEGCSTAEHPIRKSSRSAMAQVGD